ncbi:hypothetical protein [Thalassoroseus pseudoceratinae]|uniref:hypothetical protein n=1 Tax=Thalassoroseus pseudoceratinae TaxID=2713176 RepID=UPI00141F26BB|nr:hypothetical protein [Thalassoroseus pseudoceratinae]
MTTQSQKAPNAIVEWLISHGDAYNEKTLFHIENADWEIEAYKTMFDSYALNIVRHDRSQWLSWETCEGRCYYQEGRPNAPTRNAAEVIAETLLGELQAQHEVASV